MTSVIPKRVDTVDLGAFCVAMSVSRKTFSLALPIRRTRARQQALARDEGWLKYYQENMGNAATAPSRTEDADELKIANAHVDFGHSLWTRDYVTAAKRLRSSLDEIFSISVPAGAWTALWLGYAFELMGDLTNARALYRRSHNGAKNIPPFECKAQRQRISTPTKSATWLGT
jgi:hypothetical protein